MTIAEFDARRETLACQHCGLGPLDRYQCLGGEHDGRGVVVCTACSRLLELLDPESR